jgi:hypothetical protein
LSYPPEGVPEEAEDTSMFPYQDEPEDMQLDEFMVTVSSEPRLSNETETPNVEKVKK